MKYNKFINLAWESMEAQKKYVENPCLLKTKKFLIKTT